MMQEVFARKRFFPIIKPSLIPLMTTQKEKKISKTLLIIGAVVLILVLSVSAFFFFRTVKGIRQGGWKHPPRNPMGIFLSGERPPMSASGSIEPWMTFDFVSTSYHLPPEYLKDVLHIEDKKYPNIPIGRYAKRIAFQREDFLGMVRRAVELYNQSEIKK